jgi:hypothetical protein
VAGRTVWFAGFALLAAACKEEIGLLLAMQGLYAVWVLRRPRLGLVTALLAGGWSLLAVLGIQASVAVGTFTGAVMPILEGHRREGGQPGDPARPGLGPVGTGGSVALRL